MVTLTFK